MAVQQIAPTRLVRIWPYYEASMTLAGCVKRFHRNQPFIENLACIFAYLCEKFELLCRCGRTLHVFVNRSLPEVHLMCARPVTTGGGAPRYRRAELASEAHQLLTRCTSRRGPSAALPPVRRLTPPDLGAVLRALAVDTEGAEGGGLLLPFDYGAVNMGLLLLWSPRNASGREPRVDDDVLAGWVRGVYTFLASFLTREYTLTAETYLPSYYAARWDRAAILFADIRNFTPLTEILRNTYGTVEAPQTGIFQGIINEHCQAMARIIQNQQRGRVDKFLGDGVMAIFGEHVPNPSQVVCRAVAAGVNMVKRFRELRVEFARRAFGKGFDTEYNESVGLELGVGIDYGTVLFEYLGDDEHREYTAVGDHVNFAQRLEAEAARMDERLGRFRSPILISPTAERCARPWLGQTERLSLSLKGKGREYTVYEVDPEKFQVELYEGAEQLGDWSASKYWSRYPEGPPQ